MQKPDVQIGCREAKKTSNWGLHNSLPFKHYYIPPNPLTWPPWKILYGCPCLSPFFFFSFQYVCNLPCFVNIDICYSIMLCIPYYILNVFISENYLCLSSGCYGVYSCSAPYISIGLTICLYVSVLFLNLETYCSR